MMVRQGVARQQPSQCCAGLFRVDGEEAWVKVVREPRFPQRVQGAEGLELVYSFR